MSSKRAVQRAGALSCMPHSQTICTHSC